MSDANPADFTRDLVRWSETLAGIARTGLGFTQNLYERERYEEVLHVAADIKAAADDALEVRREQDHFVQEWMESIGEGVPGYVTPKVAIGAIVGNDDGEILLVKRPDSGVWLYPTGWADVGYSASEVVVKEVREETGIECEPTQLLGVVDGIQSLRDVHAPVPLSSDWRIAPGAPIGNRGHRMVRTRLASRADGRRQLVGSDGLRRDQWCRWCGEFRSATRQRVAR